MTNSPITHVSYPASCEKIEHQRNYINIHRAACDFHLLTKDIHLYYKTTDMDVPKFLY